MPLLGSLSSTGGAYSSQFAYVVENAQTANENTVVTFTINSSGISDTATLYYTTVGTVNSSDLVSGALSGSFNLTDGLYTVNLSFRNDLTTEGNETVQLVVHLDSLNGPIIAKSNVVTIIDTSTAPYGSVYYTGQANGVGSSGSYNTKYWTVPAGVTSISLVCIGSGAPGSYLDSFLVGSGGGGGALSYVNNVSVTPGETLTINLGTSPTGASYGQAGNTWVTRASGAFLCGAQRGNQNYMGSAGTRTGTSNTTPAYRMISTTSSITGSGYNANSHGGGPGGVGGSGTQNGTTHKGGGGGAGGYGAAGGYGGYAFSGTAYGGGSGSSGAGGGGGAGTTAGGPGGGASLHGVTTTNSGGALSSTGGTGGGGTAGANTGVGSTYGGGGGSAASPSAWSNLYTQGLGGRSGVRIVYPGLSRQFPSTDVSSTTNESNPA